VQLTADNTYVSASRFSLLRLPFLPLVVGHGRAQSTSQSQSQAQARARALFYRGQTRDPTEVGS
jgi:hypothetical protein